MSRLRYIVVVGMLVILCAQLIWWLVFFEMNHTRYTELQNRLDRAHMVLAAKMEFFGTNNTFVGYTADLEKHEGEWRVKPEVVAARDRAHDRQMVMLVSEVLFVLFVLIYGHYRVIRSMSREIGLIQERNIFINSVSHELKTPIASVQLGLQTLLKRDLDKERRHEILEGGLRSLNRLKHQVDNLLTAGIMIRNPENLTRVNSREKIDPAEVIKDFLPTFLREHPDFAGDTAAARASVHTQLENNLRIHMNREMFQKILENLLENAARYAGSTNAPARIEVELSRAENKGGALLRVADNGPGIPESERENVFLPLYRLAGQGPVRGTGMGLYIVGEIVRSAGGRVRARDRGDGQAGLLIEALLPGPRIAEKQTTL